MNNAILFVEVKMNKLSNYKKKAPHDWRPFIKATGEQTGPFSKNVYTMALIDKQDLRNKKGPPGAILYGEEPDQFRIGFLKN